MKQEVESVINKLKELISRCAEIDSNKEIKSISFNTNEIKVVIDYKLSCGISIGESLNLSFDSLNDENLLTKEIKHQREARWSHVKELNELSKDKNVQRYREITGSNFINFSSYI